MTANHLKEALRQCAVLAQADHPNNPELRSMKFIALLAGVLTHDNKPLANRLFALTESAPQPLSSK